MSTLSIPIPAHLEEFINNQIKSGNAANKADAVRKALLKWKEDQAVNDVLEAMKEPTLKGDLKDLVKKLRN